LEGLWHRNSEHLRLVLRLGRNTRRQLAEKVLKANATLQAALAAATSARPGQATPAAVFIIGGAQVYTAALPLAHRLELTEIQHDFNGDAHFPEGWQQDFQEAGRRRVSTSAPNGFDIDFVSYERRA